MTSRFPGVRRILHFAFGKSGLATEIDEEIAFHLESTIAELEAGGLSATDARAEAERRFGSLPEYRAALTRLGEARRDDEQRREYFDIIRQHLSYTWRGIIKRPGFALTIALTLALGLGANAVMFGIVDRLLFRAPEHVVDQERVRTLFVHRSSPRLPELYPAVSLMEANDLRGARSVKGLATLTHRPITYGEGIGARNVPGVLASSEYFDVLGVRPALGRFFLRSDDSASVDNAAVVLGYRFWRQEFNRDPSVLGRVIRLGGTRYTVVGVAPEGFTGTELAPVDLWLPLYSTLDAMYGGQWWRTDAASFDLTVIARLAPGTNESVAASELLALHTGGTTPETKEHRWHRVVLASLIAARSPDRAAEVPVSLWLAGTSLVVLLIACANVATLLLARAVQRRREIAVRLALGIGRGRLVAHLVSESVLLSGVGGLIALGIAWSGGRLLREFLLPGIAWPDSVIDGRIVVFTVGASIAAGLLAGLVPAWLESRPDLLQSLKSGGAGSGVRRSRIQGALILAQATMSVALLIGAGLFVRSLARVRALDLGLEANRAIVAFPDFPADVSQPRHSELLQQAHERLRLLPALENVALTTAAPFSILQTRKFSGPGGIDTLLIPDAASLYYNSVSPDYFAAMGTHLVRGRLFTAADQAPGSGVTIISTSLARAMWPDRDPLGHCFGGGPDRPGCLRVVGIVADTRWGEVFEARSLAYYTPLGQSDEGMYTYLVIRPRGDARLAMPALRAELLAALPGARSVELRLLQDMVDPAIRSWRVGATLFLLFGALALVVAAIGLYSVMACRVAQRRHELGVRTALGATWQDVTGLVLREGVGLVGGGILLGLLIAVAAAPAVAPLLYHTSPRDPVVMLIVAGVLLLSAAVACAIPAWRASRVDPQEALKAD